MNRTRLITKADTLSRRPPSPADQYIWSAGPVTGDIWLEVGGRPFPLPGWNDFAVAVLGWWAVSLLRLMDGSIKRERVLFMEGPYSVGLTFARPGVLRFRALHGIRTRAVVAVGECPVRPFARSLIAQSRRVLTVCRDRGFWDTDADSLEMAVKELARKERNGRKAGPKSRKAREWLAQGLSPLQLRAARGHLSAQAKADAPQP